MGWLSAILGIVSLVGGIVTAVKANQKAEETDQYNKDLNQTIMDREDSSWQRAVEDRSKSGLSVAGLSQGAGAGGTVSQLQSQQSSSLQNLSNVLQNGAGTMFGLANSAYDRKLQKQIATDELELKKDQLRHERLTARLQYIMDLSRLELEKEKSSDEHKIFEHNYKIATGQSKNPLERVYGSEPSEIERLLQSLVNNKSEIKDKVEDFGNKVGDKISEIKDNVVDSWNKLTGNGGQKFFAGITDNQLKEALGDFTYERLPTNTYPTNIAKDANGKDYWLLFKDGTRFSLSKYQYDNVSKLLGKK